MNIFKLLIFSSALFLLSFGILYLFDNTTFLGPLLTLCFVSLAIGIRGTKNFKSYSYPLFIFAAISVSMFYPHLFTHIGNFELKKSIVPLLQVIMFGMGSQLSIDDFSAVIKHPKGVIIGIICQFTIMPIIAVVITKFFGFPVEIAAGIILIGSSPSGLASNVMSFIANANIALSVTLTIVATLLAPIVTPFLMQLFAKQMIPIDFIKMTNGIMDMVILPIIAGFVFNAIAYGSSTKKKISIQTVVFIGLIILKNIFLLNSTETSIFNQIISDSSWFIVLPLIGGWIFKKVTKGDKELLNKALLIVSMVGIATIITIITAAGRDSLLKIGLLLIVASLIHNFSGYFLGYWICKFSKMDEKSCRTIALEVGMQNGGLASGIAVQMGKVATVGLAAAVFGPLMNITGSSLAIWWREKGYKDEQESIETK